VTLLATLRIVVRHIFILILETPPAVEVVPEVVECLHLLLSALVVAELRDGLGLAEAAFGGENRSPEFVEVTGFGLLLAWWLYISGFVDGVILATLYWVG